MGSFITESKIDEALALLESLRNPKWHDVYWELQEGATQVLFIVRTSGLSAKEIDSFCRNRINSTFNRLFPSELGEIAWVTTFNDKDDVVTAYIGSEASSSAA